MKTKIVVTTIVASIMIISNAFAGGPAPTRYDTYNGFAPGARAVAMGGAFCAVADDPTAIYYNPAGLSELSKGSFAMTYEATRQSELTTSQIFSGESLRAKNIQYISLVSVGGFVLYSIHNCLRLLVVGYR